MTEPKGSNQRTKGVDSARRALQILMEFSESTPELTVENLLESHEMSVPSAYRYISLLREMNLIEERRKGHFVLSPAVIKLARAAELSLDYPNVVQPVLDRLRDETGEAALYLRRLNDHAVCLAIAETDHQIKLSFLPGSLMPLHGGAAAKVLLASHTKSKRTAYMERHCQALPAAERARLEEELDTIRANGYAQSDGEVDKGVWAAAASVDVHGRQVGALTVAAPGYRLDAGERTKIMKAVCEAAAELEERLEGA